jgi:hypothetical protein
VCLFLQDSTPSCNPQSPSTVFPSCRTRLFRFPSYSLIQYARIQRASRQEETACCVCNDLEVVSRLFLSFGRNSRPLRLDPRYLPDFQSSSSPSVSIHRLPKLQNQIISFSLLFPDSILACAMIWRWLVGYSCHLGGIRGR